MITKEVIDFLREEVRRERDKNPKLFYGIRHPEYYEGELYILRKLYGYL